MKQEKRSQRAFEDEEERRRKIRIKSRESAVLQIHHRTRLITVISTLTTLLPHNLERVKTTNFLGMFCAKGSTELNLKFERYKTYKPWVQYCAAHTEQALNRLY